MFYEQWVKLSQGKVMTTLTNRRILVWGFSSMIPRQNRYCIGYVQIKKTKPFTFGFPFKISFIRLKKNCFSLATALKE